MSLTKSVVRVAGQVRNLSTSQVVKCQPKQFAEICPKFEAKRKLFQADNGLPVHLKGGFTDMVLYRATFAYAVFGAGWTMYYLIKSSFV